MGDALLPSGELVGALGIGRFPRATTRRSIPTHSDDFRVGTDSGRQEMGADLGGGRRRSTCNQNPPFAGPGDRPSSYLSFWVFSPQPLDNLLLKPNLPKVDFTVETGDAVEI